MRADQRAITQASRQSWREPACRASAARCVIKLTNKSKSARPKTIRNHNTQPHAADNTRRIYLYLFPISLRYKALLSLRPFSSVHICTMQSCGVRVVSLEHGALGICKSSVCGYSKCGPTDSKFALFTWSCSTCSFGSLQQQRFYHSTRGCILCVTIRTPRPSPQTRSTPYPSIERVGSSAMRSFKLHSLYVFDHATCRRLSRVYCTGVPRLEKRGTLSLRCTALKRWRPNPISRGAILKL